MSYIEDTISDDENIVYVVKFHWIYSFLALLYLIFLGIFLIGIFIFFKMMIYKWTTKRALTNTRYIQKTGWIARNTEEIGINKIEEVDLKQSILGRILDYGSISISGTGSGNILLKNIDSPLTFQKHLNNLRFKNN